MPKRKQPVPTTGTALIPHLTHKGMKLSYESPRMMISVEIMGNVLKYQEFLKKSDGGWLLRRSCLAWMEKPKWDNKLEDYRAVIVRDAKQGQGYLTYGS